mgnify:CR=1 FL=1
MPGTIIFGQFNIQPGIKPAAIEDGQCKPGGDAHLLCRMTEQVAQVERILL